MEGTSGACWQSRPPIASWDEAAAQTREIYGEWLPDLPDAMWQTMARRAYREIDGAVRLDFDPNIGRAVREIGPQKGDPWALFASLKDTPVTLLWGVDSDILTRDIWERMLEVKPDLEVVPVSVFWGRAPDRPEGLLQALFSEDWAIRGRVRKFFSVLVHGRHTLVRFSEPLSLRDELRRVNQINQFDYWDPNALYTDTKDARTIASQTAAREIIEEIREEVFLDTYNRGFRKSVSR